MAYTTIDNPELYFQTKIFTGNENTLAVTFDGSENMQPDWVWIKNRADNYNHSLFDSVRGVTKRIPSNTSAAEATVSASLTAFGSNGFTLGNDTTSNAPNNSHVSWNWKAGTSFTNDASGTGIGTIDSAGSVNTDAGFSIITYTGTGANGTVAHGLGAAPKMIIIKKRDGTDNWIVYHKSLSAVDRYVMLNTTDGESANSAAFNDTHPTSSVFSLGSFSKSNSSSSTFVAYCFSEKRGYSKFGKYIGNGNADGTFIYTGFKPAWVVVKYTGGDGGHWMMLDNKRSASGGSNVLGERLKANANDVGSTNAYMDFLSNGFKLRNTATSWNANGSPYIYMAFAEQPFVTSTGVPATAR